MAGDGGRFAQAGEIALGGGMQRKRDAVVPW
jgi:hypothetical protein